MNSFIRNFLRILLILVTTVSCGETNVGGGIGGSGISAGSITGKGSVSVNGVKFDTTGATITVDDDPGIEDDLQIGMVVIIRGTFDEDGINGSASSIEFEDNLEGPITSIDPATNSLVALGQTVVVDNSTVFANTTGLGSLMANDIVEVSGFVAENGFIQATRIELKDDDPFIPNATKVELKGTIDTHNPFLETFMINAQSVDYSGPGVELEVVPAIGLFVEVKGTLDALGGVLNATRVEPEDDVLAAGSPGDLVEIEGLVTAFTSFSSFEVSGQPVDASAAEFKDGAPDDLALNVRVEVEGRLDTSLVLEAREVSFR